MFTLLTIAGGVAMILFGVSFLRRGLDRLFGNRLGPVMQNLANTRLRAFGTGLGVAVVAPSSTTVSLLAVQTVQAGRLSPRQVLAIMFGADIGLTLTVQLLALRIEQYAAILILIGVALYQFTHRSRSRGVGQAILALGFIFSGIKTIKDGAGMISPDGDLVALLEIAKSHPFVIATVSTVATMLLQSSTATIAVIIGLVAGAEIDLPFETAIAWVIGANVGLACTTLGLGFKQIDSRRLGVGNLLVKLLMAAAFFAAMPLLVRAFGALPGSYAQRVAHMHTGFNVLLAVLALPLVEHISRFVEYLVPKSASGRRRFGPRYIDAGAPIDSVALALGQSRQEILHMSELVRNMLTDLWIGMKQRDERLVHLVAERDDEVDILDEHLKRFLTRVVAVTNSGAEATEQIRQLRYITELETIGDTIDKNLSEVVLKKLSLNARFSAEGTAEIDDFFEKVLENMSLAETAFHTRDTGLARQLLRHKDRLDDYNRELRDRHFARLNAGMVESHETSAIHLDLLTHLRRINSSVSHVAFAMLPAAESEVPEKV